MWAEAVGEQVAVHATVRRLRGTVLEVGVTSDAWATELTYLSAAVIERLNALLGARNGDRRSSSEEPSETSLKSVIPTPVPTSFRGILQGPKNSR